MAGRFVRPGEFNAAQWADKLFVDDPFIDDNELNVWRQRLALNGLDAAACRLQLRIDRLKDVLANDPQTLLAITSDSRWADIRSRVP